MDPWLLSEKIRLSLQIIVNYTPVPLPNLRRYDWIHRDMIDSLDWVTFAGHVLPVFLPYPMDPNDLIL